MWEQRGDIAHQYVCSVGLGSWLGAVSNSWKRMPTRGGELRESTLQSNRPVENLPRPASGVRPDLDSARHVAPTLCNTWDLKSEPRPTINTRKAKMPRLPPTILIMALDSIACERLKTIISLAELRLHRCNRLNSTHPGETGTSCL